MKEHLSDSGFSLVELIVVILIMGVLSGGSVVAVSTIYNADAKRAARNLCSMMDVARTKAIALADTDGDKKVQVALDIEVRDGSYYAIVYSTATKEGTTETVVIREQRLGNYKMTIAAGNVGHTGKDAYDNAEEDSKLTRLNADDDEAAVTKLTYVFCKHNGAIDPLKSAGSDIYVEGSELEHIIIVESTGRCYLYEE